MRKTIVATLFILIVASLATTAALAQTTPAPTVTGVTISSNPSDSVAYAKGETILVQVAFSSSVTVASGTPTLTLLLDHSNTRTAEYASGSGTRNLTFVYTVRAGDRDDDGIIIVKDSLQGNIVQTGTTVAAILAHGVVPPVSGQRVNGGPPPPVFSPIDAFTPPSYTLTKGAAVSLTLPMADSSIGTGTSPLTYTLTGPTSSPQLPAGLVFNTSTRTLSGTSTDWLATTRYTYTATDPNGNTASLPVDITVNADFDADDDQLIEVHNLAQLNAIRWDLNGDGDVSAQTATIRAQYRAAYPGVAGMGCKSVDHDNNPTTPNRPVCIGYELNNNLDFDTDGDGATFTVGQWSYNKGDHIGDPGDRYYNGGRGWTPIGDADNPFTAIFNGKNKIIANMFISSTGTNALAEVGLFGVIGKCDTNGNNCQGEVKNLGLLNASVSRYHNSHGTVGTLAGWLYGAATGCYAESSSVKHTITVDRIAGSNAGGLIGGVGDAGRVAGSYANASVTSRGTNRIRAGGLVGRNSGTITVSYATGDVSNISISGLAGGLAGANMNGGVIIASYAAGSVSGPESGGLVAINSLGESTTASYAIGTVSGQSPTPLATHRVSESYWEIGGTGIPAATTDTQAKTMTELQSPTSTTGIYSSWSADQWDFGTSRQYPAVKHNGKLVPGQREISIRSDYPNAPVAGEPVVAKLNVTGATSTAWQWQSSAGSAVWNDIANANAATYIPKSADVTRYLRARVTFTASGRNRTLTTFNTAKVVAAPGATASDATASIPVVGEKIRFSLSAAGATNPSVWRWKRCDDAAMQTGCKFVTSSEPASNAYTEYTPKAGSDTDVGKYLQAYVYYTDSNNDNAWTRGETPVLGPVAAAPPASPANAP